MQPSVQHPPVNLTRAALAITLVLLACSPAAAATQSELEAKLQVLADQVNALRTELAEMKAQRQVVVTEPPVTLTPDIPITPSVNRAPDATGALAFSGYGEVDYARPSDDPSETTADAHRFVVGISYQFDEKTRLVSELEFEHGITSAEDPGETAMEQLYVERELSGQLFTKGGLFLIPSGMLNESHEPTRYYGVFRNTVEKAIIPTTWREGGLMLEGKTQSGLRWDVGVTTGFNLSNWDPTSTDGRKSPLGSIRQQLAEAGASDLAGIAALNYTGIPGLLVGASVFSGDSAQGQPGFDDNRTTLWESHARWTPGRWDLAALYARGTIDDTADINATFAADATLIPESFFGWYTQAAYRLFERGSASLYPFVRFERINTANDYASVGPGLTPPSASDQDIVIGGVNFNFASGVVLKADYQHVDNGDDDDDSQFDVGLGFQF
jgi:predicted porin